MLKTIRIYGRLAKFLKLREFKAEVGTAAEAIKYLVTNYPSFQFELAKGHYRVTVGGYALDKDELLHPVGDQEIRLVPVIAGAIKLRSFFKSVVKILAGVALVAAAFLFAPGAALAGGLFTLGAQAVPIIAGIGASLILGGVADMLAPTPTMGNVGASGRDSDSDPQRSYSFSGVQNVSRQGVSLPIVFGEALVGSVVVSVGIDVDQVN